MKKQYFVLLTAIVVFSVASALVRPAAAQSLSSTTLSLYPADAGEVGFADLRALRLSPHYAQLRKELLPARLRELETFARSLGIDLEIQSHQMSWALGGTAGVAPATQETKAMTVPPAAQANEGELIAIIEGAFSPSAVLERARASKIGVTQASGQAVISAGRNERGQEFVFTFPDSATLVFGPRTALEALLSRRADGRAGLSGASVLGPLIAKTNGHSPMWIVMNQKFTEMGFRHLAPEMASQEQAQTLLSAVNSSAVDLTLSRDLAGHVALNCRGVPEAQLVAAVFQAGVALAAAQYSENDPDFASTIRGTAVELSGDHVEAKLHIPERQVAALLQKHGFLFKP